jgi:hypothetical protein
MTTTATGLPESVRFALWYSAWAAGRVSLDDARDGVVAGDGAHDVVGLDVVGPSGDPEPVPVIVALGRLRATGAAGAGVALPAPGDPLGLAGPVAFNAEALEVGQAVLLGDAGMGLLPARVGSGVIWRCVPANGRPQVPDLPEADTGLRAAMLDAAERLARLDVARWRPEVAEELVSLRRSAELPVPVGMAPRAQRLLALAQRCRGIVELALADDGGALTAAEADARRATLAPLDRAARRGVVAACAHPWQE